MTSSPCSLAFYSLPASSLTAVSSSSSITSSFTSLKGLKRSKSRSLAKNPTCLMALLNPFSCYSTTSLLYIIISYSSYLLAFLSLANHSSNSSSLDSDSFSRASRTTTTLISSSFSVTMPFTLPTKSFFSPYKSLQRSNSSSPSNLVHNNLAKTLPTLEDSWWFDFTASEKATMALATLGHFTFQIVRAVILHLATFASKDATFLSASWCLSPYSSRISKLR